MVSPEQVSDLVDQYVAQLRWAEAVDQTDRKKTSGQGAPTDTGQSTFGEVAIFGRSATPSVCLTVWRTSPNAPMSTGRTPRLTDRIFHQLPTIPRQSPSETTPHMTSPTQMHSLAIWSRDIATGAAGDWFGSSPGGGSAEMSSTSARVSSHWGGSKFSYATRGDDVGVHAPVNACHDLRIPCRLGL